MTRSPVCTENTPTVTVSFRIPEWHRAKLEAIALTTGRNLSQVLGEAVGQYLEELPAPLLTRLEAVERRLDVLERE